MFKQSVLAIGLFVTPLAYAQGLIVEAFHDDQTRLFNTKLADRFADLTVYNLSAPERLEKSLSRGLSNEPDVAKQQAQKKLTEGGRDLQAQFQKAYVGPMKAMSYNVEKLPAVVFNHGQHIVYGVADVNKAIQIYKKRGQ